LRANQKVVIKKECSTQPVPELQPEDVQAAVCVLSWLFQNNESPNFRALHQRSIKRAYKVLGVVKGKRRNDWRERVVCTFGLNPDNPMEVINPNAWALAWKQLSKTHRFSDALHGELENGL
jgi:hypothetical protein